MNAKDDVVFYLLLIVLLIVFFSFFVLFIRGLLLAMTCAKNEQTNEANGRIKKGESALDSAGFVWCLFHFWDVLQMPFNKR